MPLFKQSIAADSAIKVVFFIFSHLYFYLSFHRGSISSLFGYKLTTPEAVAEIVRLEKRLFPNGGQSQTGLLVEHNQFTKNEIS